MRWLGQLAALLGMAGIADVSLPSLAHYFVTVRVYLMAIVTSHICNLMLTA